MNILKKYITKYKILVIFNLMIVLFSTKIIAMKVSEVPTRTKLAKALIAKKKAQQAKEHALENQYFIYEEGTDKGIWIDKEWVLKSKKLASLVGDEKNKLALPCDINTIKVIFNAPAKNIEIYRVRGKKSHLIETENELSGTVNDLGHSILSWDQLQDAIKCIANAEMKYSEDKLPIVFVNSACYWIDKIGHKLIEAVDKKVFKEPPKLKKLQPLYRYTIGRTEKYFVTSYGAQGGKIIQPKIMNYDIFYNFKDPILNKIIMKRVFGLNNDDYDQRNNNYDKISEKNILDEYMHKYNEIRKDYDIPKVSFNEKFANKEFIFEILDIMKDFLIEIPHFSKSEEEARKISKALEEEELQLHRKFEKEKENREWWSSWSSWLWK